MTRSYDPQGKAHRVLSRLAEGPAMMETFWRDAGIGHKPNARRKLFYLVITLKDSGLISGAGAGFALTAAGRAALEQLQRGEAVQATDIAPSASSYRRSAA